MMFAFWTRYFPSSVKITPRLVRSTSWRPHSLSMDCRRFVRADWVMKRASAAFVMLRFSYNTFKIFQSMFFIECPSVPNFPYIE